MKYFASTLILILCLSSLILAITNNKKAKMQSDLITELSNLITELRDELEEPNFDTFYAKSIQTESISVLDKSSSLRVKIDVSNDDPRIILKDSEGETRISITQTDDINSIQLASSDNVKSFISIGELESDWAPMFFAGWLELNDAYGWVSDNWISGNYLALADSLNHFAFQSYSSAKLKQAWLQVGNLESTFEVFTEDENCYFGIKNSEMEVPSIWMKHENGRSSYQSASADPFNTSVFLGDISGTLSLQLLQPQRSEEQGNITFIGYGLNENSNDSSILVKKNGVISTNFNLGDSE
jgi:hypothetical protein